MTSAAGSRGDRSSRFRFPAGLAERGRLSVTEAATELEVSEATVPRGFPALAKQQLVTRFGQYLRHLIRSGPARLPCPAEVPPIRSIDTGDPGCALG
ncbi:DeoR family transcriptional regulator [Micromonospora sp. MP36]|uniref:DeoR family transcriptional regulator n=1 Tax=unclassified Micromonospora TaxID=2617518 RepID=UPI0011DAC3B2|nr:DeoR family transcriptional regulator [Micromonospora sp. MP36]